MGCIRTTPLNVLHHLSGVPLLKFSFSDSMLILKMRLLEEYVDSRSDCPQYIKCFLFKCWGKVKEWSVDMNKSRKCNCYLTEYDAMFHSVDIDVNSGYDIRNSKYPNVKLKEIISNKFGMVE